jgi:hypothetical protein
MPRDGDVAPPEGHVRAAASALDGAKRGRTEQGSQPDKEGGDETVKRSVLDDLLGDLRQKVAEDAAASTQASMEAFQKTMEQKPYETMSDLLRKYDSTIQARFTAVDRTQGDMADTQNKMQAQLAQMQRDIQTLQEGLVVASQPKASRQAAVEADFDEEPDASILRINTSKQVSKASIATAIDEWLKRVKTQGEWVVQGPSLNKNFSIVFQGDGGLAAKRARKAFQSLRNSDGSWEKLFAKSSDGTQEQIYIDENKNQKQMRTVRDGKKHFKILLELHADKEVHLARKDGAVSVGWRPLVKVLAQPGDKASQLLWNANALHALHIEKDPIVERFSKTIGRTSDVQWAI